MLADLLQSLIEQQLPDDVELEVVVVDNDGEGNGRFTVDRFAAGSSIPISYHHEPIKNISLARNKAVAAAKGDYILFIDDDEVASPTWVATMLDALHIHNADAVFGRVVPVFHNDTPEWIKNISFYHKANRPTGTKTHIGRTSNAIVKAALLRQLDGPFNSAYGITGGEDTHLFHRLLLMNASFIECFEGYVTEYVPPERTQPKWLRKRALRTGMLYVRRNVALAENPLITKLYIFAKAVAQIAPSFLLSLFYFPNRYRRLHWRLKTAAYVGHIQAIFGKSIEGY